MTIPSIVRGSYFDVKYGDGESPETFTQICGLTTKSISFQTNTSEHFIADCADPEDVADRYLIVTGQQATISGEGRYNRAQRADLEALKGVPNNYRFIMSEPAADNVEDGYYAGSFIMTAMEFGGGDASDGNFATMSVTFESTGPVAWVDV